MSNHMTAHKGILPSVILPSCAQHGGMCSEATPVVPVAPPALT